jgi:NitT/TauT family transport system permease protein
MYSQEHILFLKNIKKRKFFVIFTQIFIMVAFLFIWELASYLKILNPFLYSSPSQIFSTMFKLFISNNLLGHIRITLFETIFSFLVASSIGFLIATILWWNKFISDVIDPYLTILNSLPKVALGPLIIIWVGASTNSIIIMALLISIFVSIINIYNGFISVDNNFILLMKSMKAKKIQIFIKVILPSNFRSLISAFKINISMALIGVIMGELLVSKSGLGYLIMYGSQVFNINLTITATFILGILSYLMYFCVNKLDKYFEKKQN